MPAATQNLCYNCFAQRESPEGPCPYCGFDLEENAKKFPVALRAGTVLNDRYIVGRVLGQGGFGITYLAFDTQLQAKVAVKEYMPGEMATRVEGSTVSVMAGTRADDFAYGAERFQEEARTLAKFIGHPNIAGVSSYFDENDTSYFVMDYIEGISFKNYIANAGGKVSVDEALNVMIPVLRALTAVHAEGFIHRDVTPDNIYISKDGNVKLLDFGSARYSIGDKSKSLDVILKVGYAPKEQYIRRGRQGPYTDVYSCAACLYAALTGVLPPESLERLDHDELVPVSQAGIDIPDWLDRAILKGLAVQPEDRFQSAAEFLDAIENQIAVEVPAASTPIQPEKKKSKTTLIAGIAAVLAVVLGVGIFLGSRGGGEATSPVPSEQLPVADNAPDTVPEEPEGPEDDGLPPLKEAEVPFITIQGVEYSTDLRELNLEDASLTPEDFDELKYMVNLMSLSVSSETAAFRDLSFLSDMTELQNLSLFAYYDSLDLAPLADLTKLQSLEIISPGIDGNSGRPMNFSVLAEIPQLQSLSIPVGDVQDLSLFGQLTNLTSLWLAGDGTEEYLLDTSFLQELPGLTELHLNFPYAEVNGLEDFSYLTDLQFLGLSFSTIGDSLAGLENLTALKRADLNFNKAYTAPGLSLEPLASWGEMMDLSLCCNIAGGDLNPLANMTKLKSLYIYSQFVKIQSLAPLANLEELNSLTLFGAADGIDQSPISHVRNIHIST